MERQEFLEQLQCSLRWTFTHEEITDILSDYDGFFVSGSKEGKNERQICTELGNPSAIALDLAETLGKKTKRPISIKIIQRMTLTIALLVIGIAYYFAVYQSANIVRDSIIMLIGFTVVLWFALGGTLRRTPPVSPVKHGRVKQFLLAGHIIPSVMVIICYFLFNRSLTAETLTQAEIVSYIQLANGFRFTFAIVALLMAVFAAYGFYRFTPQLFTVIVHALGAVAYLNAVFNIFMRLDDVATATHLMATTLLIYGAAAVFTILFSLFIHSISRRAS
jgi:uncharacterized membrane protein